MENDYTIQQENIKPPQIIIEQDTMDILFETKRWTKFLAILGFVGTGIIVLVALIIMIFSGTIGSSSTKYSSLTLLIMGFIYFISAIAYFFPNLFLYRYSMLIEKALYSMDNIEFKNGSKNLKMYFKFNGIMLIVALGIGVLFFIISMIVGLAFYR